jgi:hypothetical protein
MTTWANGARALAICDICGFQYRLGQLRALTINTKLTEIKACPSCWNPDHPQYMLGKTRVEDAQAVRDPRPDTGEAQSRAMFWGWRPVGGGQGDGSITPNTLLGLGEVGAVTVTGS